MATSTIRVEGIEDAKRIFEEIKVSARREVEVLNEKTGRAIQSSARGKVSVDLGSLREDIQIRSADLSTEIFNQEVYAPAIEYGLPRGHFPPPDALAGWARRKGMAGAEWAIAINIYRRGTKPQPYLKPAFMGERDSYTEGLKRILRGLGE